MTPARVLGSSLVLLILGVGCSFVEPQAGAPQAACGISFGGGSQSGTGAGYYGTSSGQTLGAPTCAASMDSADSTCDACENTHCCATRSACYGDPVCACADLALDECLDSEASSASDKPGQVARCWDTFSAKGTVEQAFISCQRSWCQTACGVP